jgi:hypothetical protein
VRKVYFTVFAIGSIAAALTACGSSSPTGTAAGILSQSGATSGGSAYVVDSSQGNGPSCDNGSAEADGSFAGGETINVCVFPNTALLKNDAATAMLAGPGGQATIQVGKLTLVYLTYCPSQAACGDLKPTARQVAARIGGVALVP